MKQMGKFSCNIRNFSGNVRKAAAEHPENVKRAMTSVAHYLRGETQKRTPVLTGQLTGDIQGEVQEHEKSASAVVSVPVNAASASYAVKMHEGHYNLGELSQKKQTKVGVQVGRKFITRAIDDNFQTMEGILLSELRKPFNSGGGNGVH